MLFRSLWGAMRITSLVLLARGQHTDPAKKMMVHTSIGMFLVSALFIYVTAGTQEVKWYKKAMENINNYEEIHCSNTDDCIQKYKKLIFQDKEAEQEELEK